MSHDDQSDHNDSGDRSGAGGPDTRFLDFELPAVMYDEAEAVVREAYRELLKDAAKQRIQAVWGDRITALAELAVDEAMADTDANLEVQALIAARNDARRSLEERVQAILRPGDDDDGRDSDDGDSDDSDD